jgi:hypothetical protein
VLISQLFLVLGVHTSFDFQILYNWKWRIASWWVSWDVMIFMIPNSVRKERNLKINDALWKRSNWYAEIRYINLINRSCRSLAFADQFSDDLLSLHGSPWCLIIIYSVMHKYISMSITPFPKCIIYFQVSLFSHRIRNHKNHYVSTNPSRSNTSLKTGQQRPKTYRNGLLSLYTVFLSKCTVPNSCNFKTKVLLPQTYWS